MRAHLLALQVPQADAAVLGAGHDVARARICHHECREDAVLPIFMPYSRSKLVLTHNVTIAHHPYCALHEVSPEGTFNM